MSNVINILEKLAADSNTSLDAETLSAMADDFGLGAEEKSALTRLEQEKLEEILKTNPSVMAIFFPAEDDEDGDEGEGEENDESGDSESRISKFA